jgi:hypothetical protein
MAPSFHVVKIKLHLDFLTHLVKIIPRRGILVKREIDISHSNIEIFKVWMNFLIKPETGLELHPRYIPGWMTSPPVYCYP